MDGSDIQRFPKVHVVSPLLIGKSGNIRATGCVFSVYKVNEKRQLLLQLLFDAC